MQDFQSAVHVGADKNQLPPFLVVTFPSVSPLRENNLQDDRMPGRSGRSISHKKAPDHLFRPSPTVMQWDQNTWIWDIRPVARYWQLRSEDEEMGGVSLLLREISSGLPSGQVVAANHPWPGLLLSKFMSRKRMTGFVDSRTDFGKKLFEQIAWQDWFDLAMATAEKRSLINDGDINAVRFRKQLLRMSKFASGRALKRPCDLQKAGVANLPKNMGASIAEFWFWTWGEGSELLKSANAFPWKDFRVQQKIHVTRRLEHQVFDWSGIEHMLQTDFDALSQVHPWGGFVRVTELNWSVECIGQSVTNISIVFRHPHSLTSEAGHHATALAQAKYAFDNVIEAGSELELAAISGWVLSIQSEIVANDYRSPNGAPKGILRRSRLISLENRLPISISFLEGFEGWNWGDECAYNNNDRPLFIYEIPKVFAPRNSTARKYSETIKPHIRPQRARQASYRDYYHVRDARERLKWVFRDGNGQWFEHGLFS